MMRHAFTLLLLLCVQLYAKVEKPGIKDEAHKTAARPDADIKSDIHEVFDRKSYKTLLKVKLQQQSAAIQSLYNNADTKSVKAATKDIFTSLKRELQDAQRIITDAKFIARSTEFPTADPLREAVARVVENTAMLMELVLYLPDYAEIWYQQNNMKSLAEWAYYVATKMALYDDLTFHMFETAAQELEFIPRGAGYNNPHRRSERRRAAQEKAEDEYLASKSKKSDSKKAETQKPTKSKPKMSKAEL